MADQNGSADWCILHGQVYRVSIHQARYQGVIVFTVSMALYRSNKVCRSFQHQWTIHCARSTGKRHEILTDFSTRATPTARRRLASET